MALKDKSTNPLHDPRIHTFLKNDVYGFAPESGVGFEY